MLGPFGYGHMMGGLRPLGGLGVAGLVLFLVFAAVVVGIIIWAIARRPHSQPQLPAVQAVPSAGDTALQIARERLARGEIDPEQYRAIVGALST